MSVKYSGFSDEISDFLDRQIEVVKSLGMEYISIRGVDGKNISEYSVEEFENNVLKRLNDSNVKISSIGSPIGKIFIDDKDGFEKQLIILENLCKMANLANCGYIRMFSFFIKKEEDYDIYKDEVVGKLKKFVEIAKKYNVILLHENEKDIFGDIARRCNTIFEEVNSEYLKGIFDFANFVQCEEDTMKAYEVLKKHLVYYHIKDASYDHSYNILCGTGDGKIPEILEDVLKSGYQGFLTMEPHLAMFGSLQSLELEDASTVVNVNANITGEEGYKMQYDAIRNIVKEIEQKI